MRLFSNLQYNSARYSGNQKNRKTELKHVVHNIFKIEAQEKCVKSVFTWRRHIGVLLLFQNNETAPS